MEFFLDTASIKDIKHYSKLGLVDGVTTNPALLAKEGRDPISQIKEITSIVSGPLIRIRTFLSALGELTAAIVSLTWYIVLIY